MPIEIVSSSPQALDAAKNGVKNSKTYPFDKLEVGKSFTIPYDECNLQSLQVITSRKSKGDKKFKMIKHDALQVVEVARIS